MTYQCRILTDQIAGGATPLDTHWLCCRWRSVCKWSAVRWRSDTGPGWSARCDRKRLAIFMDVKTEEPNLCARCQRGLFQAYCVYTTATLLHDYIIENWHPGTIADNHRTKLQPLCYILYFRNDVERYRRLYVHICFRWCWRTRVGKQESLFS